MDPRKTSQLIETKEEKRHISRFPRVFLAFALGASLVLIYLHIAHPTGIAQNAQEETLPLTGTEGQYFLELPHVRISLAANNQDLAYIDTTIVLEMSRVSARKEIIALLPRIMDTVNIYLHEIAPEELQEAGGLYHVKEALLTRINFLIAPAQINDILFKQMYVGSK